MHSDESIPSTTRSSWILTPDPSPRQSPAPFATDSEDGEEEDDDDDGAAMGSRQSSRPISVIGSHIRPTLDDVLADRASPPFTLSAFTAHLHQNHCLETLEFTIDARRYGGHYSRKAPIHPNSRDAQELCELFKRLLTTYIKPGATREINLPSTVRDALLSYSDCQMPPPPSSLDAAIKRMRDLMDESIFFSFLNSQSSTLPPPHDPSEAFADMGNSHHHHHHNLLHDLHPHGRHLSVASNQRTSVIRHGSTTQYPPQYRPHIMTSVSRTERYGSSAPASTSGESANLTDDTGSYPSSPGGGDPVTPPTTPPSGELHSPRGGRQDAWKKMGMKFGWKK